MNNVRINKHVYGYFWSSTQYSGSKALTYRTYGFNVIDIDTKTDGLTVIPFLYIK